MNDTFGIKGYIRLQCKDKEGNLKWDTGFIQNTITNLGKAEIAKLIGSVSGPTAFGYLALGTSNTAPAATDTTLVAEIVDSGLARANSTETVTTTTTTGDTVQFSYTWTASGSKTIEEIGIFNAASAGVMLGRALTTSKAVSSGETITGTYQIRLS